MLLYFPAEQDVHVPLSGPVYPVLQVQVVLPDTELKNAGQAMQFVELVAVMMGLYVPTLQLLYEPLPGVILYFQAEQPVPLPPLGPVYPWFNWQLVIATQIVHNESEFAGHDKHGVELVVGLYQSGTHR